jgi:hypothetical protein
MILMLQILAGTPHQENICHEIPEKKPNVRQQTTVTQHSNIRVI